MAEDGRIKTEFDDFIASLKSSGGRALSVSKLAEICKVPDKTVREWAHILEHEKKADIINRFDGVYVLWAETQGAAAQPKQSYFQAKQAPMQEILLAREREEMAKGKATARASRQKIADARNEISGMSSELSRVESAIERLESMREAQEQVAELNSQPQKAKQEHFELGRDAEATGAQQEEKGAGAEPELDDAGPGIGGEGQSGAGQAEASAEEPSASEPGEIITRPKSASEILAGRLGNTKGKKTPKSRFSKMKKPAGLEITEVSLKFSDRMARQLRKIERAAREVEQIRAEKEQFLNEMYLPMQRKLESEVESISDRITKIESGVFDLQKRASDLPEKVAAIEKLQASSINAHGQMRKAYDEAAALIEQSNLELSGEISRMEEFSEHCRHEIAGHSAKTTELQKTLDRINQYEGDLAYQVSIAREAMSQQAERLASAEKYASELATLREEIRGNVAGIRREMGSTKGMLTDLERQMVQVRHVSKWAGSIKSEYETRMQEIDDYIKNGNAEFETLREAVEARFVRKYLRELRSLSESYTFELNQAKSAEEGIDSRVEAARKKLAELLEQGQKLAYKYESAAKIPEDSGAFKERAESFESIEGLGRQATQVEQVIAQMVGGGAEPKTQYETMARVSPRPAKKGLRAKPKKRKRIAKKKGRKGRR